MPYIKEYEREYAIAKTPGELNFLIHELIAQYLNEKGLRYNTINDVVGVLSCVQAEFYRRIAAPYEDKKKAENGDIVLYHKYGEKDAV